MRSGKLEISLDSLEGSFGSQIKLKWHFHNNSLSNVSDSKILDKCGNSLFSTLVSVDWKLLWLLWLLLDCNWAKDCKIKESSWMTTWYDNSLAKVSIRISACLSCKLSKHPSNFCLILSNSPWRSNLEKILCEFSTK
ncbi:hypothetical protein WICPIJ_009152 [Wickerhamomyces pijperi]|uniref:Uncharacterized protein n=1 Tax=Wickerhamomyces pijperi TaxID=599730 RepID=A0A9P8PQ90_WICPI|nr:hypothetical protein WICPIJ_009152 [Wickerhamomyces pijperi]